MAMYRQMIGEEISLLRYSKITFDINHDMGTNNSYDLWAMI